VRDQIKAARSSTDRSRRAESELDNVSAQLGEVLRQADELLAEWQRFGVQVRAGVDREVATIGGAVGDAIDGAVDRAAERASTAVDAAVARTLEHAVHDRIGALAAEIGRLEQRTKAAARAIADDRARDRWMLWAVIGGVVLANVLLAFVLLREPVAAPPAAVPAPVPVPVGATDEPAPVEPDPVGSASTTTAESAPSPGTTIVTPPTTTTPAPVPASDVAGAGSGSADVVPTVKPPAKKTRRVPARRATTPTTEER
jgi:hypothetical protein